MVQKNFCIFFFSKLVFQLLILHVLLPRPPTREWATLSLQVFASLCRFEMARIAPSKWCEIRKLISRSTRQHQKQKQKQMNRKKNNINKNVLLWLQTKINQKFKVKTKKKSKTLEKWLWNWNMGKERADSLALTATPPLPLPLKLLHQCQIHDCNCPTPPPWRLLPLTDCLWYRYFCQMFKPNVKVRVKRSWLGVKASGMTDSSTTATHSSCGR